MSKTAITADTTRGFDVMRGSKLLASFATYAEAWAYAAQGPGRYVHYWAKKP